MITANEELFNANVRHQVSLNRLATGDVRELVTLFNETQQDILTKLANTEITEFSRKRLEALFDDVRDLNKHAYAVLDDRLTEKLTDTGHYEIEFQLSSLQKVIPVHITLTRPTLEQIKAIITEKPLEGRFIRDEVKDLAAANVKRIEQAIRIGRLEGETTPEIVHRIRGTRSLQYKDGLLQRSRGDVERLVRTSITHVTARARDELYQNNNSVIKAWRFTATLDRRTSVICASLDGQSFDLGTGPIPPRHANCRSGTTPVLKSWEEMGINLSEASEGTRASLDGQVPESVTYQEWLKKQSRNTIEDVLGKKKSKLFLDGKLPLDKFVDFTGKEYTLSQLRALESSAFADLRV